MDHMKQLVLNGMYTSAKFLAGTLVSRIGALVTQAEQELAGRPGPEKKAWLLARLRAERAWARSFLAQVPSTVASAIVDVLVAWAKTRA